MVSFGGEKHRRLFEENQKKRGGKESIFKTEKSLLEIKRMPPKKQADALGLTGKRRKNFLDSFRE